MFKKLLLSLLVAVPVIAQAEWLELLTDNEYTSYIDPERTVSTSPSLQQAETWIKMVIHTDLSKDGLSVGDHKMVKFKFKCNSNEMGLAAMYFYKKTGQMIDSYVPSYVDYEAVIPESKGEMVTYVVCDSLYGEHQE
ncbi:MULTISPECIES: surface-adhesin E family protein [unclassified Acinetobacter]|uniref:surface-adhesin E family protein n=1 Tax=unclassified Acinetobacter TaxID=196816 RepID=UPI0015D11F3C|nr:MULTISPECIES: surface-adhesin E family protein [unclassified Acinetobacter]QOW51636.1 hypothetical protein G0029_17885 [Acinetobacter sp. YH12138]